VRFLILSQYYLPEVGAAQTRLGAFARALVARGHEVEIVTAMPHHLRGRIYDGYGGAPYRREMLGGALVHRTWVYASMGAGMQRLLNYATFCLTSLYGLARARRPDLIFVESPPLFTAFPGWLAALRWGVPMVFNVADMWPDTVRDLGVMRPGFAFEVARALERWAYGRADYINVVMESHKAILEKKGVSPAKLRFLPNGVDVRLFAPSPADRKLRDSLRLNASPVFLYAGTHGLAHGLEAVLAAAALLDAHEAQFVFVGGGTTKRQLMARAEQLRLHNVHFLDPVPLEELPRYYSLAYAAIVSLGRRTISTGVRSAKIFPAFASGVPVIHCGNGEGAELVRDAGGGIVTPPEDAASLACAVRSLIAQPNERDAMAERARAFALERCSWEQIVDRWLATLPSTRVALNP
jgi:glycosyltransferase involved in cell wall biosynthesis